MKVLEESVVPSRGRAVPEKDGRSGYTLVETLIAILLVAMVVTSTFSMVLTARMGFAKAGFRGRAYFHAKRAMERVRAYVASDTSASIPAPNSQFRMPGDTCNCYALQAGSHDITSTLPDDFRNAPVNGRLVYNVSNVACGTQTCKRVDFTVTWDE